MSPPDFAKPPIPSLGKLSEIPDQETNKGLDLTGPEAKNRVMLINIGFFKYGTNDKSHAAAVCLSIVLLIVIVIVSVIGMFSPSP